MIEKKIKNLNIDTIENESKINEDKKKKMFFIQIMIIYFKKIKIIQKKLLIIMPIIYGSNYY